MVNVNPLKGFRDLYPNEKGVQSYIFEKIQNIANLLGFEAYDGPVVEPMDLYTNKTSKELLNRQTFQIQDKKGSILILRPEITPTLARMIAKKANELIFPIRLYNIGVRFRYEAPQKGRAREFFQADFDILGSNNILADAEIIYAAISIMESFGAKNNDFILYINSRDFMEQEFIKLGIPKNKIPDLLSIIDKKEKIDEKLFNSLLLELKIDQKTIASIVRIIETDVNPNSFEYFKKLFSILKLMNIDKYCKINPSVVRGLNYYTGFVFEIFDKGNVKRSLLGGGRYNNLINQYNSKLNISGVGFALSDVVIQEFLQDKKLLPTNLNKKSKFLITIFNSDTINESVELSNLLRKNNISCEIYLDEEKSLEKQLKYADKKNIPYVLIVGPDEIKKKYSHNPKHANSQTRDGK